MDRDELRALQAPLKRRYRDEPASARFLVAAEAAFGEPVTVTVPTWAGSVRAGLHTATGGDGSDACSGDMLMQALVACVGVTLYSVCVAFGVELREVTISAEGVVDARGTLGVDREADVGVHRVRVEVEADTDADDAILSKVAAATERHCVVGQSLRVPPAIHLRRR